MPLYEYSCQSCGGQFELLCGKSTIPQCPDCCSSHVERLLSVFAVRSDNTRRSALADGRRAADKTLREQRQADHEIAHNHDH